MSYAVMMEQSGGYVTYLALGCPTKGAAVETMMDRAKYECREMGLDYDAETSWLTDASEDAPSMLLPGSILTVVEETPEMLAEREAERRQREYDRAEERMLEEHYTVHAPSLTEVARPNPTCLQCMTHKIMERERQGGARVTPDEHQQEVNRYRTLNEAHERGQHAAGQGFDPGELADCLTCMWGR